MRGTISFLLFSIFFLVNIANAQRPAFIFKNFTQEEGLPSNEAYCVFEDSKHYIWIGTDQGVVRFNGNKFQLFKLPDNIVFQVKEDTKGRIWFFTHKAKLAYLENEKIHFFGNPEALSQRFQRIQIIQAYFDQADNLTLASGLDSNYFISPSGEVTGAGVYTSRPEQTNEFIIDNPKPSIANACRLATSFNAVDTIRFQVKRQQKKTNYTIIKKYSPFSHYGSIEDGKGNIFFFGGTRLFKLRADGTYAVNELPSPILCLKLFGDGLLVGMRNRGAVLLNTDLSRQAPDTILPTKSITSIATDYSGGLWFSTLEDGVFYVKNTAVQHLANNTNGNDNFQRTMSMGDTALVYATLDGIYSYRNGRHFTIWQRELTRTSDLSIGPGGSLFYAGSIDSTPLLMKKLVTGPFNHLMMVGTTSEPAYLGGDTIVLEAPRQIHLLRAAVRHQPSLFNNEKIIKLNYAKVLLFKPGRLFRDHLLNLWCGTDDGLYRFSSVNDSLIRQQDPSGILSKGINHIRELANGPLVLGLQTGGIALFQDSILTIITETDGLLSNKVKFILSFENQLWVATALGISVIKFSSFHPVTFTVRNIGKNAGIFNTVINQLMLFGKQVVAATTSGIYLFNNARQFATPQTTTLPFYVQKISYYGGDTSQVESISLPFGKTRLVLKLSAISFNSPEKVEYFYRFDRGDTIWHKTTNDELSIENLPQGNYNLELKAALKGETSTSPIIKIGINAEKAWWQGPWLALLVITILTAMVYWFLKYRVNKIKAAEKKKVELNAQIAALEQTALRSQMNPHFIFNCLTSIQQLIVSGNSTDANEYLLKFSGLIRKTFDLSSRPFISISEEIDYLGEYLFLEQLRLSEQFDYVIETTQDIKQFLIPNMMIQPVVENCIRHGIKPMEKAKGVILVKFTAGGDAVICEVTDNGIGREKAAEYNRNRFTSHKSFGIDILKKRLYSFEITGALDKRINIVDLKHSDGSAAGTKVILHLPFKTPR